MALYGVSLHLNLHGRTSVHLNLMAEAIVYARRAENYQLSLSCQSRKKQYLFFDVFRGSYCTRKITENLFVK